MVDPIRIRMYFISRSPNSTSVSSSGLCCGVARYGWTWLREGTSLLIANMEDEHLRSSGTDRMNRIR